MMQWCPDLGGWGGHWFGGLLMLLSWIVVVVGIAAIVRWFFLRFDGGKSAEGGSPLEILQRRYARGEIDKAEFEEKRKDILGS